MVQQAYSATAFQKVANFTSVDTAHEHKIVAALKFTAGLPLKVSVVALAALELSTRAICLIIASPLYILNNKYFSDMTEKAQSAAQALVDASRSLFKAAPDQKPSLIEPSDVSGGPLSDAIGKTLNHPKAVGAALISTAAAVALFYAYPTALSYCLQEETTSFETIQNYCAVGPERFQNSYVGQTVQESAISCFNEGHKLLDTQGAWLLRQIEYLSTIDIPSLVPSSANWLPSLAIGGLATFFEAKYTLRYTLKIAKIFFSCLRRPKTT